MIYDIVKISLVFFVYSVRWEKEKVEKEGNTKTKSSLRGRGSTFHDCYCLIINASSTAGLQSRTTTHTAPQLHLQSAGSLLWFWKGPLQWGEVSCVFFNLCSFKKIFLNTQNTVYYITLYQHATQVFIKYKIIYEGQNVVAVSFHWPITLKYRMWLGLSFNHICVIITFNSWKLKAVSASSFQLCNIKDISDTHVCEPLIKTLGGALIRVFFLLPCDTDNLY